MMGLKILYAKLKLTTTPMDEEGAVSFFCIGGILSWPGRKFAPSKRNAGSRKRKMV